MTPLLGLLLLAAPPAATPTTPLKAVAVLPMQTTSGHGEESAPLLTTALAEELARLGQYKVISADDVAGLLQAESNLQIVGTDDGGPLAEAAGALGAQLIITSELIQADGVLTWTATLQESFNNAVIQKSKVAGSSISALLAQTPDVALALCGRASETRLEGPEAQKRYGFKNAADLAAFKQWRGEHPALSTDQALTEFVIARNVDSNALAVLQAVAFTAPVVGIAVGGGLFGLAFGSIAYSWGAPGAVLLSTAGAGAVAGALLAMVGAGVGVTLVVIDLLNLRHVEVSEEGCCRDDAAIRQARDRNGLRRAAAVWTSMSAPLTCLGMSGMFALGVSTATVMGFSIPKQPFSPLAQLTTVMLAGALMTCGLACCVVPLPSLASGLAVLFWPEPAALAAAPGLARAAKKTRQDSHDEELEDAP